MKLPIQYLRFWLPGIFSNSHLPYEYSRDTSERGVPSLTQMTVTALKLLTKYPSGFLLMVTFLFYIYFKKLALGTVVICYAWSIYSTKDMIEMSQGAPALRSLYFYL